MTVPPQSQSEHRSWTGLTDRVADSHGEATRQNGVVVRSFLIAGHRVDLHFAGAALVRPLTRAIEHLSIPSGADAPTLRIHLWQGAPEPPTPAAPHAPGLAGEAWVFVKDHVYAVFRPHDRLLNVLDLQANQAYYWLPSVDRLPFDERVAPLRHLLNWWLRPQGLVIVHAGAIGFNGRAAVVVGRGGAGKSTTTLACVADGFEYLGDNYVLVSTDPTPTVHGLYNTATLHGHHLARFPQLMALVDNHASTDREKAAGFLHEWPATTVSPRLPIGAVLLPVVSGNLHTSVSTVSAAAALRALAPSSVFALPGAHAHGLREMAAVVRGVQAYELALGTLISGISPVVASVLASWP